MEVVPLRYLAILAVACGSVSHSDSGVDGGPDGGVDAGPPDGGSDGGRDSGVDAALDAGPGRWSRVSGLPEDCRAEYTLDPELVLQDLRWEPCSGAGSDDCEILTYVYPNSTIRQAVYPHIHNTADSAHNPLIALAHNEGVGGTIDVLTLEPRLIAAWRFPSRDCLPRFIGANDNRLGFEIYGRFPDYRSYFFLAPRAELPALPDLPLGVLTEDDRGLVGTQRVAVSDTTIGTVLQPGGVYWFFEEGRRQRRGGPLEDNAPGTVSNSFGLVGRRIFWAFAGSGLATAEHLEAPAVVLRRSALLVGNVFADDTTLVWTEGSGPMELWAAPIPDVDAVELSGARRVAEIPEFGQVLYGDGMVASVTTLPERGALLVDLADETNRHWSLPDGYDHGNSAPIWVNRREVGLSVTQDYDDFTVVRVPVSSFR